MGKSVLLVAGMVFSAGAVGAEWGLTGAVGSGAEIRVPIKQQDLIFEPYISYNDSRRKSSPAPFSSRGESTTIENRSGGVGLGVWKLIPLSSSVYVQWGGQLGYVRTENTTNYASSYSGFNLPYRSFETEKTDGFKIAPGVGVFYQFNSKFEAGIEVKYSYQSEKGEIEADYFVDATDYWQPNNGEAKNSEAGISGQALVRIYF